MNGNSIGPQEIRLFGEKLRGEDRGRGTIEKYLRDVRAFAEWLAGRPAPGEAAAAWREHLLEKQYRPATVNSMLAAVNKFFFIMGRAGCRVG